MTVIPFNTFAIVFRTAVLPEVTIFALTAGDTTSVWAIGKWIVTTRLTIKHGVTVAEHLIGATGWLGGGSEGCAGGHCSSRVALIDSDTVSVII